MPIPTEISLGLLSKSEDPTRGFPPLGFRGIRTSVPSLQNTWVTQVGGMYIIFQIEGWGVP